MGGWEKRLEELSHLKDGWYDGEGYSISADAIENAKNIMECLQNHYKQENLPTIFPTPYGWVQLQRSDEERGLYGEVLIGPMQPVSSKHGSVTNRSLRTRSRNKGKYPKTQLGHAHP
jgi:hypothetical protein